MSYWENNIYPLYERENVTGLSSEYKQCHVRALTASCGRSVAQQVSGKVWMTCLVGLTQRQRDTKANDINAVY